MHVSFESVEKGSNIIDVRSKLDYDKKHLKGSINIPRLNLLKNHENYLNKNDIKYVTYRNTDNINAPFLIEIKK